MSLDISILWQLFHLLRILKLHQGQISSLASFHHATSSVITLIEGCLLELEETKSMNVQQTALLKRTRQGLSYLHQLSAQGINPSVTEDSVDLVAILGEIKVLYAANQQELNLVQPHHCHAIMLKEVNKIRLTEALCCLVNNAFQSYQSQNKTVSIAYYEKKNGVQIKIQDFGQGMSSWQSQLVRLPLLSFRKNGTGIGLSFANQVIVNNLGGNLWIQSIPNFGTTVCCFIPKLRVMNSQNLSG